MACGIGKMNAILFTIEDFISSHSIFYYVNVQSHCFRGEGPL